MKISTDWKGLYELLNDLIRQEDAAGLEASLSDHIDNLIPADRGAAFFEYYDNSPHCIRWPDYATRLVPDFNARYGKVCPVPFNLQELLFGPISWRRYRNSEYDTDFNRPLHIGHSVACGFMPGCSKTVNIIAMNRSRGSNSFSHHDTQNLRLLTGLFATLYNRIYNTDGRIEKQIRQVNMLPGKIPLSSRETEICMFLCKQGTAGEIAEILGISPRTVERHCLHIYYKMNVANRNELLNLILTAES
ncbi:MAG: helix-turn-helix transcriptional regulator [Spirochaetaceae bacterium]|nr:helix-turn-helix transcriptional regulator [Spirochaetaceae bacterium]MCF7938859.1 helix-turn-helix transcriptional regulator [Spirochaetales bacterium]